MTNEKTTKNKVKEMINDHWGYNLGIIEITYKNKKTIPKDEVFELCEYFYTKAMVHGMKHESEGRLE